MTTARPPAEASAAEARTVATVLAGLCVLQLGLWSAVPALSYSAPPLDVVEMAAWGREGVVATWKHPNLPGLVLAAGRWLGAGAIWPSYVLSQLFVVATYLLVYRLGRELMGSRRALAGTLLLTGLFYTSWPTPEMNNNLAQLPLWALVSLALWRSVASDRLRWWAVLGLAGGLVLWAKYTSGLLLVVVGVWLVADPEARARWRRPGPWLATLLALAVAAPQAYYLLATDFLPLGNATARATGIESDSWPEFLLAQAVAHVVLLSMAAVAGLFGRGATRSAAPGERRARRFLTVMALGPVALTCAVGVAAGVGSRDMWGMPMFDLSGLLLLAWLPGRFGEPALRRIVRFAAVLLVLLPVAHGAYVVARPALGDRPARVNWPQSAIADHFARLFEAETGAPLEIVAGPPWEAGLVALTAPSRPSVLEEGELWKSPWVTPERLARQGFLAVWPRDEGPSDSLAALLATRGVGEAGWRSAEFSWSSRPTARPVAVGFAVVAPTPR